LSGKPKSSATNSTRISVCLTRHTGKRVAYCDTGYGTAFYGQGVLQPRAHPEAFDFDVLYSNPITDVPAAVRAPERSGESLCGL
jgi:hypothetical protein